MFLLSPILTIVALFTLNASPPIAIGTVTPVKPVVLQQTISGEQLQPAIGASVLQPAIGVEQLQGQTGGNGQNIELQPALGVNDLQ